MKYRYLGNSGLAVSVIGLGTATFGRTDWGCNEETSLEILNEYVDAGGNFIDTSDQYANKGSECIIGKWLKNQNRDDLVIATKCFFPTSNGINNRGLSRKHIINACDASLKRLNTDYIDLYQMHEVDLQTPMEETINALSDLIKSGKVRYIGLSNQPAWRITKAHYISKINNYSRFISGQYLYNLLKRDIENEIIPACKDAGMGIVCWSPLSGGMLTGKYQDPKKPVGNSRIADRMDVAKDRYEIWYNRSKTIIKKVIEIAKEHNKTPAQIALSWLLKDRTVSSVITGARNSKQIYKNCKSGDWILPNKAYEELNDVLRVNKSYPYDVIENVNKDWLKNFV